MRDRWQSLLQRGEALVLAEMAQEAQDQREPMPQRLRARRRRARAVEHGLERHPRGVRLRVEEEFGMDHAIGVARSKQRTRDRRSPARGPAPPPA